MLLQFFLYLGSVMGQLWVNLDKKISLAAKAIRLI